MAAADKGFELRGLEGVRLPEYNPLLDRNLSHFFCNPKVQRHLLTAGLIDRDGRILDLRRNRQRIHVLEQEYRAVERQEHIQALDAEWTNVWRCVSDGPRPSGG